MIKKRSINLIVNLSIMFICIISLVISGCKKAEAPKTILIGTVTDQTGPLTAFGVECKYGFSLFEKEINADGGIYVKEFDKKIPIEILYGDHSADEQKAVTEFEYLVDKGAVVMSGTTALSAHGPATAEKNKVALVGIVMSLLEPFKQGFKYCFNTTSQNDYFQNWPFLVMEAAPDPKPTKIGVMDEKNLMGVDYTMTFQEEVKKRGFTNYVIQSYQRFSKDLTTQIQTFKKEGVDLVYAPMITPDGILFFKQMKQLDFNPKAIIMLSAPAVRAGWLSQGKDGDYVLTANAFHWELPYKGVKEFSDQYRKDHKGENPTELAGCAYAAMQLIKNAIERAGSLNRDDIRDAIAETDNFETIIGPMKFNEDGTSHTITPMVQYQNLVETIVLPKNLAKSKMVYPFPKWKGR